MIRNGFFGNVTMNRTRDGIKIVYGEMPIDTPRVNPDQLREQKTKLENEAMRQAKKQLAAMELIEDAVIDDEILGFKVKVDSTLPEDTIIMTDGVNKVVAKVMIDHSKRTEHLNCND